MAAVRVTLNFKANGVPSRARGVQTSCFIYVDSTKTDDEIKTVANHIAALSNGTLVSITKQIHDDAAATPGDATAHGGSDTARIVMANRTAKLSEQVTIPFMRQDLADQAIEDVLEDDDNGILNRLGSAAGQVVKVTRTELVDG